MARPVNGTIEYRQKIDSPVWHWMHTCTEWPTVNYVTVLQEPTTGVKCKLCREIEAAREKKPHPRAAARPMATKRPAAWPSLPPTKTRP